MKFKAGDKVRVRHGLEQGKLYNGLNCNTIMATMAGEVLTIKGVGETFYAVEENIWCWTNEMLEPVTENTKEDKIMSKFKAGDKVKVREDLKRGVAYYSNDRKVHDIATTEMVKLAGQIVTIEHIRPDGIYLIRECGRYWTDEMFETTSINTKENNMNNTRKVCYEIVDYKYNPETGETYIKWSDLTETRVKPESNTEPNQYVGFVTAYAKKAAGNTSHISSLFDKWAVKMPAKVKIEAEKEEVAKIEAKRIAEKRKAKREKWFLRREALRRKRAYDAAQLANKKYGVPMDFKEEE